MVVRNSSALPSAVSRRVSRSLMRARRCTAAVNATRPEALAVSRARRALSSVALALASSAWPWSATGSGICMPTPRLWRWLPETTKVS